MIHKLNKKGFGSRLRISGHASPEALYRLDIQYESYRISHLTFTSGELCFVQYRSSFSPQKSGLVRRNQNKEYEIG